MNASPSPNRDCRLVRANSLLNEAERRQRRVVLQSYPKAVFLQLDAPCNQDCLFCSRPPAYRSFDLDDYRRRFGERLEPALERAERLHLTGSGEFLLLPRAREILDYVHRFPCAEKMFATNGSSLTPKMADRILESGDRYCIHLSLHASSSALHADMTRAPHYDLVLANIRYLTQARLGLGNVILRFVFVATTRNVEDLPAFVRFAADHGADEVQVYYNFVYRLDQKPLSCYFAREGTLLAFAAAGREAARCGIPLSLPPAFGQQGAAAEVCGEAWSQLMVNPEGDVITCDIAGYSRESLLGREFMDVWNGEYYRNIRSRLAAGERSCAESCLRANPSRVNDFRAHFIARGKGPGEIERFLEGT